MLSLGRKYGVSDNAIRKWCKQYGIDCHYKKSDITKANI
jgi:transposase-like protein